jgi:hypothetical protein
MCAARRHQLDRSERSIHEDAGETKDALGPSSMRTWGRRRTPSHLKHEDAGETKDALPPEDEEAQNLLILRSEATAEPRRRGGFAIVPLAGEVGEREAQAR